MSDKTEVEQKLDESAEQAATEAQQADDKQNKVKKGHKWINSANPSEPWFKYRC
ncbi:hypothetical protein JCM19239_3715 [Vibrio variabilis]|uniref:Uncharacterized protein n=1 Tax=Vibrio variabilis TaxID=990271 RepID=A0ABQ0J9M6_9VIBR|nr:hypothetical protein JCM19239_3715 [Vibrio variabilis]